MPILIILLMTLHLRSKIEKVPRDIQGEKSRKNTASSRKLVSKKGAIIASPQNQSKPFYFHLFTFPFLFSLQILNAHIDNTWIDVQIRTDVDTTSFSFTFIGLDPNGVYAFRVNVKRMDGDKVSSEWTTGDPTENTTAPCIGQLPLM